MPEFLTLHAPEAALNLLLAQLKEKSSLEWVEINRALGRVTAIPVMAVNPLPSFPRSTVDGYAVRAAETFGASESLPAYLYVVGEVTMGAGGVLERSQSSC